MSGPPSSSGAARLGAGCLWSVLLFAAVAAANHRLLTPAHLNPQLRLGLSLVSALFLALGLGSFWSLLRGQGSGQGSRAALFRRTQSGERPADGGAIVATGAARALSAPLVAPLSGVPCVAYSYRLYRFTRLAKGRRGEMPVYWGYASRPFALDGGHGRSRVLAVPQILGKPHPQTGPAAEERARVLVGATSFEEVQGDTLGVLGTAFQTVREIFTDDDGEARRDWHRAGDEGDLKALRMEESVLPLGQQVSVHGTWSAEREAIVAGDPSVAFGVSAAAGPLARLEPVLPSSTVTYLVTATILTLLGGGLVWFGREILPSLV